MAIEKDNKSFNQHIKELEECVEIIENPDCEIEEALKIYERGITIVKKLESDLKKARQKIDTLES